MTHASALGRALSYLPKDAPLVVVIDTDLASDQYRALDGLLDRLFLGDEVKKIVTEWIAGEDTDFERDLRPLLGHPLVWGAPDIDQGDRFDTLFAIQTRDERRLKDLAERWGEEAGEREEATLYEGDGDPFAVDGEALLIASSKRLLEDALKQHTREDTFHERAFATALERLPPDAVIRAYANVGQILRGDPGTRKALKVKWLAAVRTLGLTIYASNREISVEFALKTVPGTLSDQDLPIAGGKQSPAVVRRAADIAFGVRDPSQVLKFAQQMARVVDPAGFGEFEAAMRQIEEKLEISLDKVLLAQLTGDLAVSVNLEGDFAARAEPRDPEALERTLEQVADALPEAAEELDMGGVELTRSRDAENLYTLSDSDGDSLVLGVVGGALVAANDAEGARRLSEERPAPVFGTQGSIVFSAHVGEIADQLVGLLVQQVAAELFTMLGERFRGWLEGRLKTTVDLEVEAIEMHMESSSTRARVTADHVQAELGSRGALGPLGEFIGSVAAHTGGLQGNVRLKID